MKEQDGGEDVHLDKLTTLFEGIETFESLSVITVAHTQRILTLTSELIGQQHDVEDLIDLLGVSLDAIGNVMIATTTAGMRLNKEEEEGRE